MKVILTILFIASITAIDAQDIRPPIEPPPPLVLDKDKICLFPEKEAEFPGGKTAMMAFLQSETAYPQIAKDSLIQGRVFVQFIVNIDGTIEDIKVVRGISVECDEEAIRVVKLMPIWKPALNANKPVRSKYVVPFMFKIH